MNELCRTEFSATGGCAQHAMTELREAACNVFGDGLLKQQAAIQSDFPARGIGCSLWILPVVDQTYHHLQMALWLHVGAHYAKTHDRLTSARKEGRNDGVERALAAADQIRMSGLE